VRPALAHAETLALDLDGGVLKVTIDRPGTRNALSVEVVEDLCALAEHLATRDDIQVVTLRGQGGSFCAGGDIGGFGAMVSADASDPGVSDPLLQSNQRYGDLLVRWNNLRQVTIALIEGAAFGGGVGLACVVDIALATRGARFAISETRIGIVPAQIAPFLIDRVGATAARRAALTGRPFGGDEAKAIGLVSEVYADTTELEAGCDALIADVMQCAPTALATTKALLLRVGKESIDRLMDDGARLFVAAARSAEGREGVTAFLEKRAPSWNLPNDDKKVG